MHNVRIRKDPGWSTASLWQAGEQASLDTALQGAVNGDGGGTWTPAANLVIAGQGLRLIATTHELLTIGSVLRTSPSTSKYLTHGDSDYCVLGAGHSGATQTLTSPMHDAQFPSSGVFSSVTPPFVPGATRPSYAGAPALVFTALGATARVPLRVHHDSLITQVTFPFSVLPSLWAGVPSQLPQFGVFAADCFGKTYPLSATAYQTIPTPANLAAWENGGLLQTMTYACDPSNPYAQIDTTQFSYFAEIVEVSGANSSYSGASITAHVAYGDPTATFTNILDIHPR